jgi:hypothetical protein
MPPSRATPPRVRPSPACPTHGMPTSRLQPRQQQRQQRARLWRGRWHGWTRRCAWRWRLSPGLLPRSSCATVASGRSLRLSRRPRCPLTASLTLAPPARDSRSPARAQRHLCPPWHSPSLWRHLADATGAHRPHVRHAGSAADHHGERHRPRTPRAQCCDALLLHHPLPTRRCASPRCREARVCGPAQEGDCTSRAHARRDPRAHPRPRLTPGVGIRRTWADSASHARGSADASRRGLSAKASCLSPPCRRA